MVTSTGVTIYLKPAQRSFEPSRVHSLSSALHVIPGTACMTLWWTREQQITKSSLIRQTHCDWRTRRALAQFGKMANDFNQCYQRKLFQHRSTCREAAATCFCTHSPVNRIRNVQMSWRSEERCAAVLFGSAMVTSVYAPDSATDFEDYETSWSAVEGDAVRTQGRSKTLLCCG